MDEQTLREKLRSKIYEKKKTRINSYSNTISNFSDQYKKAGKVSGFRKQQEFGLKKRIKP